MTVLFLAELVSSLEASMLYAAIPTIARQYGVLGDVAWLITGYTLVHAIAAVLGSRLGDQYGRKRVLIAVLLICSAGSLLSALADDLAWIIAGRMIQGATGAILPLAFGICREVTPPARTAVWLGVLTGAWSGSAALGYVLGGLFTDLGNWQGLFWVTATLPLLVAGLAWRAAPPDAGAPGGPLDVLGAVLLVPAISLVLLAISGASRDGWLDPAPLTQLGLGLACLAAWAWVELRTASPLVDVRQLRNPNLMAANLAFAMIGLGGMQLGFLLMLLIQQPVATGVGFGLGASLAALIKLPSNLVAFVASPLGGLLAARSNARAPLLVGAATMTIAWFAMIVLNDQLWQVIVGTMAAAIGLSLVLAAVPNLVVEAVPSERTSEANGLPIVVRGVFAAIGAQVLAALLAVGADASGGHPTEQGYRLAMGFVGLTSLAVLVAGLLGFSRRRTTAPAGASRTPTAPAAVAPEPPPAE